MVRAFYMTMMRRRRMAVRRGGIVAVTRDMPARRVPASIAHIDVTPVPVKPASTPAPETEPATDPDTRSIRDAGIAIVIVVVNIVRVVNRHVDVFRTHRRNRNVIAVRDLHAIIAPQMTVL